MWSILRLAMGIVPCLLGSLGVWTLELNAAGLITSTLNTPTSIHSADLDADGYEDVLCASSGDNTIAWYKNMGHGVFSDQRVVTQTARGARAVRTADMNRDGLVDILSASSWDNTIAWYENLGEGKFSNQRVISQEMEGVMSVFAADLNNDGWIDVLSASPDAKVIAWHANLGNGTFEAARVIARDAESLKSVYGADINNDGLIDVLGAFQWNGVVPWYQNLGNGNFSFEIVNSIGSDDTSGRAVAVGDLNNDRLLDVIIATDRYLEWFPNLGNGNFTAAQQISGGEYDTRSLFVGDLNDDGHVDIVVGEYYGRSITMIINRGSGTFSPPRLIAKWDRIISVLATDLNGDGILDVVGASAMKLAWYLDPGFVASMPRTLIAATAKQGRCVQAADLNNDGLPDVLSASRAENKIAWYSNEGNLSFSSELIISSSVTQAVFVAAADLNADGLVDVLSASYGDDAVVWFQNEGNGAFSASQLITDRASGVSCVHAADLDGDGLMDVLTASSRSNTVAWHRNIGNGDFSPSYKLSESAIGASAVVSADINGDGLVDVLSASMGDNTIALYLNEGGGKFSPKRVISSRVLNTECVYAADLNNDGFLDVIGASNGEQKVVWFSGDGSGNFVPESPLHSYTSSVGSVHAADLNHDGWLDIIGTSGGGNTTFWFINQGGSFSPLRILKADNTAGGGSYATTADLNNDGLLEVLSIAKYGGDLDFFSWEVSHISVVSTATEQSCVTSHQCTTPPLRGPSEWQFISIHDNITITQPWKFPPGGPVTLIGTGEVTVECHTNDEPCLQFDTMDWVTIRHLTITGSSNVLIDAQHLFLFTLESVNLFTFERTPTVKSLLEYRGLKGFPMKAVLSKVTIHDSALASSAIDANSVQQLTIHRCQFTNVTNVGGDGGAIHASELEHVQIEATSFRSCSTSHRGGAMTVTHTQHLDIKHTTFYACDALSHGGAILGEANAEMTMINTTIVSCHSMQGDGGGMYIDMEREQGFTMLRITSTWWVDNTARHGYGGGMVIVDGSTQTPDASYALIENSEFANNEAKVGGGMYCSVADKYEDSEDSAVQVRSSPSELKLHTVTYTSNAAESSGGGIHTTGVSLRIVDCVAMFNTASLQGGFLWSIRGALVMSETRVWHNAVVQQQNANPAVLIGGHSVGGGGLFLADCRYIQAVLFANEIWNNSVTAHVAALGGGLYAANCMVDMEFAVYRSNAVIENHGFMNVSKVGGGGAVALNQFAELKSSDSFFTWNRASGHGGAITCLGCKAVQLGNCSMKSNQGKRGGGIFVQNVVEHVMISGVRTSSNIADEGGSLFAINSHMEVGSSYCYDNVAVAPAHDRSRGGCACITSGSTASFTDTVFTNNHAGLGGSLYVQCGSKLKFINSSFSKQWERSPQGIIGRGMYSECTAPDYATMSALQRTSGAVKGVIVATASSVFESISTTSPVLIVHTHSQNGRICTEDNATTCTLQAASEGFPVTLLSPSAFNASQGVITIVPFLFQGLNVKSVHLRLECQGFEPFSVEQELPVSLPVVQWSMESVVGIPSDSSQPEFLEPPPQVTLTSSPGHLVSMSGAICFVSLHQSQHNNTDEDAAVRLLGQTSAVPETGTAAFRSLGVDAPFGSTLELHCTCQLRSGTEVYTASPLLINVVMPTLSWVSSPSRYFLPSGSAIASSLNGGSIRGSTSPAMSLQREITCSLQLQPRAGELGTQRAFEFRQPIQFTVLFNDSAVSVPSFELIPRLPPASTEDTVLLTVQCIWINRQAVASAPVHILPAKFDVELLVWKPVYRLDLTPLSVNVRLSTKDGVTTNVNGGLGVGLWYLPSMTCSLSALLTDGSPGHQILDHVDNNLVLRPKYNASLEYATVTTSVRVDASGGLDVNLAASCQVNGLIVGNITTAVHISAVTASWYDNHSEWFPASGDYQTVLQQPFPSVAFYENGQPVNSTEGYTCYVAIDSNNLDVTSSLAQNGSTPLSTAGAVLLSPPAGGYRGAPDTHVVQLDRVIVQAPFHSHVYLRVTCYRQLEPFQALYTTVFMREPLVHAVEPRSSVSLYPREPFQVRGLIEPDDTLTRAHANIQCALEAPDAEMRGASATAVNGTVTFESVMLLGVVGSRYNLSMVCQLGNRQLSSVPTFIVIIESCPGGTEPSDDKTACLPCADDAYSDGGGQPCRKCPEVGVACSSGTLRIQPGYYPFDTRFLQGLHSPGTDHAYILPSTVFYPCWNDEACSMNSTTRGISCSKGYGGPLCGLCDAKAGYVSAGSNCILCWPSAVNAVILTLGVLGALFLLTYVASFQRVKGTSSSKIVLRIGVTYVQMLASLGLFRAQATETFRAILGVAEGVGTSLAASPPVQCTFHFGFYTRFLLDLGLPVFVVPVTIACAVCVLAVKAIKASRRHRNALNFQHRPSLDSSNCLSPGTSPSPSDIDNPTSKQDLDDTQAPISELVTDTAHGVRSGKMEHLNNVDVASSASTAASLWSVAWRIRLQSERKGEKDGDIAAQSPHSGEKIKPQNKTVSPTDDESEVLVGSCTSIFAKLLRQYWKQKLFLAPSIFIVFFLYNSVSATIATMFRCRAEEIDGKRYLAADLGTECYTSGHVVGMVVTAIVALVFNIGFPLVLFLFLRRNAARLTDKKVFMRFGFLYQGYSISRNMYGWEALVLLRKFVVVVAASAIDDPWYQSMAGIGIVFTSLCLQLRYRPYESNRFNRLEELVLLTVSTTQVITLLYLRSEALASNATVGGTSTDVAVTTSLLIINAATCAVLVISWWRGLDRFKSKRSST